MDIYFNNTIIGSTNVKVKGINLPNRIDYYTPHKVNDEVRGYLVFDGAWNFVPPTSAQQNWIIKKLALILESPHKDEYQQNSFIPIGPARGKTGITIERLLVNRPWINSLKTQFIYEVFILNAIQYQCSAWNYISGFSKLNDKVRDNIFKVMWSGFTKQNFVSRITDYSPDVIVNCCTGMTTDQTGNVCPKPNSLADLVESAMSSSLKHIYHCDYHPATLGKMKWK